MGRRPENINTSGKVQQLYSTRAEQYEKVFVDRMGWGRELDAFFRGLEFLQPSMKILDAGCGTGVVTRTLYRVMQDKGYGDVEFHAFDLTENMLDVFRQQIGAQGLDHVHLAQADVLRLDSLTAGWTEYDLVVSSALLEHIPVDQIEHAIRNLKGLLKQGGRLLLIVTRRTFLTGLAGRLWWKTNLFDAEQIKAMLGQAGFQRIEFRELSPRWSKYIMVVEATN